MSCQSLAAARAFDDKDIPCGTFHRSVRFSSESRSSVRAPHNDGEKKDGPGSLSLLALSMSPSASLMSQSAPATRHIERGESPPLPSSCRFPKLEECAHFHYERVSLGGLSVELAECAEDHCVAHNDHHDMGEGWICLRVRSHVSSIEEAGDPSARGLSASWSEDATLKEWNLTRSAHNFLQLDEMLHRCIYDRKVSGLPDLSVELTQSLVDDRAAYRRLVADYVHHLSIIADDAINCGPVLNWLQMDNRGHKLLVSNEDSSSINTPAVAAAYSVRKYVSQARDEISFEVGDMISIIDMPGPQESVWWRGKRGFRVGFFPHHCVAVIGDKVPRHMTQPPPIVGSVAMAPIKPVLRKHGKLISLFRSFILSRPSRRSLKQQGILRERVFGCDLGEHLLNCGHDVPVVLVQCGRVIESLGAIDGVYRLSGGSGLTQRLRAAFDGGAEPDLTAADVRGDPHALASLLKMYFRELPNPLCTYQLYESFVSAVQPAPEALRLQRMRDTVVKLPPPHYRTLAHLSRHLRRVSLLGQQTGMTARNMAIVWAPNLLRAPRPQHALSGVAVQAVVTEFLIVYAEELFSAEQGSEPETSRCEEVVQERSREESDKSGRRPKSLPIGAPAKLLSLEEARRRGRPAPHTSGASPLPPPPPAAPSPLAHQLTQLRPDDMYKPKYIEVGSGPNNLPQYHTVLDLPVQGVKRSRGLKRSPSGWKGLFSRSKLQRPRPVITDIAQQGTDGQTQGIDVVPPSPPRAVLSCESLSDGDTVAPLNASVANGRQHTRSSSCDSYFEPWQSELADMRLRLAPQERDRHMFSEEEYYTLRAGPCESACSSPMTSELVEQSPFKRDENETQQSSILSAALCELVYIDVESPRAKAAPEKRHGDRHGDTDHKRICKDRQSPLPSSGDSPQPLPATVSVKMREHSSRELPGFQNRERNSPRKSRNITSRYSGFQQPISNLGNQIPEPDRVVTVNNRLSWQGDGHATLIRVNWQPDASNLATSNIKSTPATPIYEPLESDSELSENKVESTECSSCDKEKCLKCELKATDYSQTESKLGLPDLHDSLEPSPVNSTEISYQNLNRLSAVSTSSDTSQKREAEVQDRTVMTSSHESSSSCSNSKDFEFGFKRPNYINLNSSSTSKSSPSPLKSPLKSTISITFRSPVKNRNYDLMENLDTPTNDRDSLYENVDLDKDLAIFEEASVPETDACLPEQQACQPDSFEQDLIILETEEKDADIYSQVKFFRRSIDEVNAMVSVSDETNRHYENVPFPTARENETNHYENVVLERDNSMENGNVVKGKLQTNLNVKELAIRFESPTEQKGPFNFDKFKADIKYPSDKEVGKDLNKTTLSLDENALVKELARNESEEEVTADNNLPDLNLNLDVSPEPVTPMTENKISLVQRDCVNVKTIIEDADTKLSRERIEKYKEERRNFLREKYCSQSFRTNVDQLTRLKLRKEDERTDFERRNTMDGGQRKRLSLARSADELDSKEEAEHSKDNGQRKEKMSPSYNIRDMAALFEQKSQSNVNG